MNVLIINGHPTMETSNANKAILEDVKRLLPEVEISELQALYPNYQFDIAAEQAKLVKADVIVWQFPLNWYSLPALLKKWVESLKVVMQGIKGKEFFFTDTINGGLV